MFKRCLSEQTINDKVTDQSPSCTVFCACLKAEQKQAHFRIVFHSFLHTVLVHVLVLILFVLVKVLYLYFSFLLYWGGHIFCEITGDGHGKNNPIFTLKCLNHGIPHV